jgi:threonine/homoserine/homoserine lactone efflux protein
VTPSGLAWLFSAGAFAVSMSATPGPNNAMVTASGATWGFARTLPHMLGIALGFPLMLVAVSLGAGAALRGEPWVHDVLRWAGAAYLLWLAWRIATAAPGKQGEGRAGGRPMSFLQAALFQWMNPKAWVIALGAVVTYTTASGAALVVQAVVLAAIFALVILPSTALWTAAGVGAARLLRTPRALRAFNLAMAALLVGSLVPLLVGK